MKLWNAIVSCLSKTFDIPEFDFKKWVIKTKKDKYINKAKTCNKLKNVFLCRFTGKIVSNSQ